MKKVVLYIHGKSGSADEAKHYEPLFADSEVRGFDYKSTTPWEAKAEFTEAYRALAAEYDSITIVANSIGACFAMYAELAAKIERAFFISPIADMEKLITDMMRWAGVSESELAEKQEIVTAFGETLSWKYLCYVRANPPVWNVPTDILYGRQDNLTSFNTIAEFAKRHNATLTVMPEGEHWFHTDEQMKFLDAWLRQCLRKKAS